MARRPTTPNAVAAEMRLIREQRKTALEQLATLKRCSRSLNHCARAAERDINKHGAQAWITVNSTSYSMPDPALPSLQVTLYGVESLKAGVVPALLEWMSNNECLPSEDNDGCRVYKFLRRAHPADKADFYIILRCYVAEHSTGTCRKIVVGQRQETYTVTETKIVCDE